MSGILLIELVVVGQQGGRLSWPYGDKVPGNYLSKAGLPAFSVLVALAVSSHRRIALPAAMISLFSILISVMTGERINFLIRACGGMLAALIWRPKIRRLALLFFFELLAVLTLFYLEPTIGLPGRRPIHS